MLLGSSFIGHFSEEDFSYSKEINKGCFILMAPGKY